MLYEPFTLCRAGLFLKFAEVFAQGYRLINRSLDQQMQIFLR